MRRNTEHDTRENQMRTETMYRREERGRKEGGSTEDQDRRRKAMWDIGCCRGRAGEEEEEERCVHRG
jgi:hypothetical protein